MSLAIELVAIVEGCSDTSVVGAAELDSTLLLSVVVSALFGVSVTAVKLGKTGSGFDELSFVTGCWSGITNVGAIEPDST